MGGEVLIRPHHLFHVATLMSGWKEYVSVAENQIEKINRYTLPDQIVVHDRYHKDLVGENPKRPMTRADLEIGALADYAIREYNAMSVILTANDDDIVKLISCGKDIICNAAAIGNHCIDTKTGESERDRILTLQKNISKNQIGEVHVFNVDNEMTCYGLTTLGVLRDYLWLIINEAEILSEFTVFGRYFELGSVIRR